MENSDQRRTHGRDDEPPRRRRHAPGGRGAQDRESRDYGSEGYGGRGGREDDRYARGGSPDEQFSPDWSRDDAEPLHSDDAYYSRNRGYGGGESNDPARGRDYRGGAPDRGARADRSRAAASGEDWQGDRYRTTTREQRERGFQPRGGGMGGLDPDAGFGGTGRGLYGSDYGARDERGRAQRGEDDEPQSYYRGYYNRSVTPYSYPGGRGQLYTESWTLTGPHTGRGPKGYKRSSQQIIEEASQRLEQDGEIDATEIEVTAEDGVITLQGTVPDRQTKRRAEHCVESVYGVRDVMNQLRVERPGDPARTAQPSSEQGSSGRSASGAQTSASGGSRASPSPSCTGGAPSLSAEESGEDEKPPKGTAGKH
jgi:hypothetical protein